MYSEKFPLTYEACLRKGMKGSDAIRRSLPFVNQVRADLGLSEARGIDRIDKTLSEIEDALNGKTK